MAGSLQKIDRLIEGQGQLVELAVTTKAELDQVKKTGELTAKGLANLTTSTQKQFEELSQGQETLRVGQENLITGQDALRVSQGNLKVGQEALRVGQESLTAGQDTLRVGQESLQTGQELILQILREKLP